VIFDANQPKPWHGGRRIRGVDMTSNEYLGFSMSALTMENEILMFEVR
jgi:hypothetical protein